MPLQLVKLLDTINITNLVGGATPRGNYDDSTDYDVGDIVSYTDGSSYIMYTDGPAGTLPTDSDYWSVIAQKGDTGATGATGSQGPPGNDGADGADGEDGADGTDGVDGTDGLIQSIVAGTHISVDNTDPANPVVSSEGGGNAEDIAYDPSDTTLPLVATNVQDAIDELDQIVAPLTSAQPASGITYDNSSSGLTAGEVQSAIDELAMSGGGGQSGYGCVVDAAGGADYTSLSDAITDGQTSIYIRNGSYSESDDINCYSAVNIAGESRSGVVIAIANGKKILLGADKSTIRNVTLSFDSGSNNSGLWIDGSFCEVANCHLYLGSGTNARMFLLRGGYCTISGSMFESATNSTNNLILFDSGYSNSNVTVTGCIFKHNSAHGNGFVYSSMTGVTFTGCTIVTASSGSGSGISLVVGNGSNISGCTFISYQVAAQIAVSLSSGSSVSGCNFIDYATAVQTGNNQSNCLITGNKISQSNVTTPTGIYANGHRTVVSGNQITGRSSSLAGDGIKVGAYDDCAVTGNVVNGYANGVNVSSSSADRTLVAANNLYNNTAALTDSGTGTVTGNNVT